ncbi:MAG TPA: TetR/AcrR family transcriptional regulator [Aeromicrobium sp.]|nr:TetR/AcrR family transcriptional regulator [Aeromicrobium sp.]
MVSGATGTPRATRSRQATRERLLDAAAVVLAREGIQGASVEHICDQAGFTRGAFYSNFSSKDELVMALFERERDAMLARMREAADPTELLGQELADVIGVIMERFLVLQPADRDWYLAHAEFELRGVRDDEVGRAFNVAWKSIKDQVASLIEAVLAQFDLRLTVDVRHAATVLMGTYDHALRESLIERRDIDRDLLRTTLPSLLLAVVAPIDCAE